MRKVLKYVLWLLGGVVLLAALAAAYNALAPVPSYEFNLPEKVEINYNDSVALARGAKLVSMTCVHCHRAENGRLEGVKFEEGFGEIYVANITNHPTAGIGRYSDEALVHILRTGIKPDGRMLVPIMPQFFKMSDDDLHAIIAYLRSDAPAVAPSDKQWPEPRPNFLAKALMRLAFHPAPMPEGPVVAPPVTDQAAHGEYLADFVLDCYKCHSASFTSNDGLEPRQSAGYYGGGNPLEDLDGQIVLSANLTMHPEYGLGAWTLEEFGQALRYGKKPDGTMTSSAMPPFTSLTDEEVAAIWAFLQTVPILANDPGTALAKQ